jgi:transmembrane sensor
MDETIARAVRGEATPRELAELEAWRTASRDNERHYQEVVYLLTSLRSAAKTEQYKPPIGAELLARMERKRGTRVRRVGLSGQRWLPWSLAASALLVLALQFWVRSEPRSAVASGEPPQPAEIVTGEGELATLRMADGSVARVAPRSRVRMLSTGRERTVSVEGHAFFAVASDSTRPFRVRTSEGDLVALGTRFDVRTEPRGLRLAVLEGRVALYASGERREVAMGEAVGVSNGVPSPVEKLADPAAVTRWMKRFLAFQSTDLPTVALEIERVYGRRVVLADPSLVRETVTATFTDETLDQVVRVVCTVVGVECVVTDSQVTISR